MFKEDIESIFGCELYYTLGHISFSDRTVFYKSEEELKQLLKEGLQTQDINFHAWLTFPTMEILDITFPTSYAIANGYKGQEGGVIALHADAMKGSMRYNPMLVGDDFLHEIGAIRAMAV